jgi:elongation factor Ts
MNLELIKDLRARTGAGISDCSKALEEANGDIDKATEILREKGIAKAVKKSGRTTNQGIIASYIHPGAQLGVLVEVNCETDFVARTDEFKVLANDIALQIAASAPEYVDREAIPEDVINREKEIYKKQLLEEGKPEHCLLELPFIRNEKVTILDLIKEHIAKFGENITVGRFVRFKVGE